MLRDCVLESQNYEAHAITEWESEFAQAQNFISQRVSINLINFLCQQLKLI